MGGRRPESPDSRRSRGLVRFTADAAQRRVPRVQECQHQQHQSREQEPVDELAHVVDAEQPDYPERQQSDRDFEEGFASVRSRTPGRRSSGYAVRPLARREKSPGRRTTSGVRCRTEPPVIPESHSDLEWRPDHPTTCSIFRCTLRLPNVCQVYVRPSAVVSVSATTILRDRRRSCLSLPTMCFSVSLLAGPSSRGTRISSIGCCSLRSP